MKMGKEARLERRADREERLGRGLFKAPTGSIERLSFQYDLFYLKLDVNGWLSFLLISVPTSFSDAHGMFLFVKKSPGKNWHHESESMG